MSVGSGSGSVPLCFRGGGIGGRVKGFSGRGLRWFERPGGGTVVGTGGVVESGRGLWLCVSVVFTSTLGVFLY